MKRLECSEVPFTCPFDLEAYMMLSQTKRITGELAQRVGTAWDRWRTYLKAFRLGNRKGYVLVYFESNVEDEVDEVWERSPSEGFELQCVAQTMIMLTMGEVLPELSRTKCAPVPEPNKILKRSLEPLGLAFDKTGGLNVKYGVITAVPLKQGCEACYLKESCPKKTLSQEYLKIG
ncbi:MAG: hypothetical protein ACLFNV_11660 [Desulfovibrionales bacterium]